MTVWLPGVEEGDESAGLGLERCFNCKEVEVAVAGEGSERAEEGEGFSKSSAMIC
jgi:hypothetical protein